MGWQHEAFRRVQYRAFRDVPIAEWRPRRAAENARPHLEIVRTELLMVTEWAAAPNAMNFDSEHTWQGSYHHYSD